MFLRIVFLLLLCSFGNELKAQNALDEFDYSRADSIAVHNIHERKSSLEDLATNLTKDLTTEHEKFRVLFRWVTHNISYKKGAYSRNARKVLRNRKAVCEGYAYLLQELCGIVGIDCKAVDGISKTRISNLNEPLKTNNHSWNVVNINGNLKLADPTWCAGYYNEKRNKFYPSFSEDYFFTVPEVFMLTHFPDDKKWLLIENSMSKKAYIKSPIFYHNFSEFGIQIKKTHGKRRFFFRLMIQEGFQNQEISLSYKSKSKELEDVPLKLIRRGKKNDS